MAFIAKLIVVALLQGWVTAAPKLAGPVSGLALSKRGTPHDCKYGGDYHGPYTDGSGTYVKSDSIRHSFRSKCWNDYFVVKQSVVKRPWKPSGTKVWCTGSQTCAIATVRGEQFCRSHTDQIDNDIGVEIMKVSLKLGVTYSETSQNCYQGSTTTTCTWNDKACHTVWTQQEIVHQEGYKRQRCNKGGGDYTDCMSDWSQEFATNTPLSYGCGSKCEDSNDCGRTDGKPCPKASDGTQQLKSLPNSGHASSGKSSDVNQQPKSIDGMKGQKSTGAKQQVDPASKQDASQMSMDKQDSEKDANAAETGTGKDGLPEDGMTQDQTENAAEEEENDRPSQDEDQTSIQADQTTSQDEDSANNNAVTDQETAAETNQMPSTAVEEQENPADEQQSSEDTSMSDTTDVDQNLTEQINAGVNNMPAEQSELSTDQSELSTDQSGTGSIECDPDTGLGC